MFGVSSRAVSKYALGESALERRFLDCPITEMDEKVGKSEIVCCGGKLVKRAVDSKINE